MRKRWSVILPIYGLALFSLITLVSARVARRNSFSPSGRYFWWGATRLDSDPLNKHFGTTKSVPCPTGEGVCIEWDPETVLAEPGIPQKLLVIAAIPPFVVEGLALLASAKLGINQIPIFFVTMPILLFAWFYFLGWALDRLRYKRFLRSADAQ